MCTLAWGETGAGLWICFNRDEQRDRRLAEAPRIHEQAEARVIYARDPQGGGTWFAASTAGFAVALLNCYPEEDTVPEPGKRSRGKLVLKLAGADSGEAALDRLESSDLADYAPFFLFILSPDGVTGIAWDGNQLTIPETRDNFWTTSSFAASEVIAWRKAWWARQLADHGSDPAALAECLRQPQADKPAYGATMDREDARTLSQIDLRIGRGSCTFTYREREPEGSGYDPPVIINFPSSQRSANA
jgi:hypothetical protein